MPTKLEVNLRQTNLTKTCMKIESNTIWPKLSQEYSCDLSTQKLESSKVNGQVSQFLHYEGQIHAVGCIIFKDLTNPRGGG